MRTATKRGECPPPREGRFPDLPAAVNQGSVRSLLKTLRFVTPTGPSPYSEIGLHAEPKDPNHLAAFFPVHYEDRIDVVVKVYHKRDVQKLQQQVGGDAWQRRTVRPMGGDQPKKCTLRLMDGHSAESANILEIITATFRPKAAGS